ncbi:MAG TPA: septal ring lytic transglycosylase RlpA family protein [Stellaceae bacterium]|nr:septal ring lytic transglycosylase RlpA family protein [Stellaceae bacterium]
MVGRPFLAVALSGLLLAIAGCASRSPPPGAASHGTGPAAGEGFYKVGAPYQVGGVWYYPHEDWAYDESGLASWYGEEFHGRYTANGEIFNLNALTAAHDTLPLPTIVEVTNLDNGRTLRLRVNDRGPYVRGRIIDVSRRAAQLLGFEIPGTAKVRVKLLVPETQVAQSLARRSIAGDVQVAQAPPPAAPASPAPTPILAQTLPFAPDTAAAENVRVVQAATPEPAVSPPPPPPRQFALRLPPLVPAAMAAPAAPAARIDSPEVPPLDDAAPRLPERVSFVQVPAASSIYVQAGAFTKAINAYQLKARLERLGNVKVSDTTVNGVPLYRVRIGPVLSVDEADRLLNRIVDSGLPEARIIVD